VFDADRADAVDAVAKQQSQIIFLSDMCDSRLALAKPSLWPQVLEEGMQTLGPLMLAALHRQAAGNRFPPPGVIGEPRTAAGRLCQSAGHGILEEHLSGPQIHVQLQLSV